MKQILLIDNHDSFTYILKAYLKQLPQVSRVDVHFPENAMSLNLNSYHAIVISPGPGLPQETLLQEIIHRAYGRIPLLGVCLGMQAIIVYENGQLMQLEQPLHGAQVKIHIIENYPFFNADWHEIYVGLYHSWGMSINAVPSSLKVTSYHNNTTIAQSLIHIKFPLAGVQFHPESHLTQEGMTILKNWFNSTILS
ncbi:MAG: gamma-glutamyl-gamma-aminobutyrate hydrolase family protein [Bacteroidales bacterium]|nr:gamma-glutamyl-gamma-aminobutyrate hydrolase family protein [Bacteroidales bacterium]